MSSALLLSMMFSAGIAIALQPSINARLAQKVGVIESACISFAVGTVALLLVVLIAGKGNLKGIGAAAWWELTGGFFGAFGMRQIPLDMRRVSGCLLLMAGLVLVGRR